MACVYIFFIFSIFLLLFPSTAPVVQYISSSVLQLVLLPCLLVGAAVLNRSSEHRAAQDHKMLLNELAFLKDLKKELIELKKARCEICEKKAN